MTTTPSRSAQPGRVLVTNDDGIDSPGLSVLVRAALARGHQVVVAAPAEQYSGASASLTGEEVDGRIAVVTGGPPDLPPGVVAMGVKAAPALIAFLASYGAFGPVPDYVLSGVNLGANTGKATLHSGTVGAALSAATHGIASMAVSIASGSPRHWDTAQLVTEKALAWLETNDPREGVLNINVPDIAPDHLRGLREAALASFGAVQAQVRPIGEKYVQVSYSAEKARDEPGSDHYLLSRGWATVTLLRAPIADTDGPPLPAFDGAPGTPSGDPVVAVDAARVMTSRSSATSRPPGEGTPT
ncbi:5'/3'-nucleotidase SurE [Raineyella fluvialis]|uniref:5'-nucleotidase n=1 Tax=Raineyella fluvialis TaxID=2662261 RepID=A0A5Q2FH92_9ACTN|nr:5'/3'-nucleotidase SurE [Raineyella fluvialis]QGF24914.1 5'/3'-nucleotidase SurE [Raineyella fluvialis]